MAKRIKINIFLKTCAKRFKTPRLTSGASQ